MIEHWQGALGTDYPDRDPPRLDERRDVFRRFHALYPRTALEVGCSAGHNLHALSPDVGIGVEPNPEARRLAIESGLVVIDGDVAALPFDDHMFDLVLSAGVLIHVPPGRVGKSVRELARVTRDELLLLEYMGEGESLPYRGLAEGIWKRDYGAKVREVDDGWSHFEVHPEEEFEGTPFEGCTGWLFRRS